MAKQQVEDAVEAIAQELLKDQDVIELVDVEYVCASTSIRKAASISRIVRP